MNTATIKKPARVVEVTAADLPLHCPTPSMQLWNQHPRVFLDVGKEKEVLCPYCGTKYVYKGVEGTCPD